MKIREENGLGIAVLFSLLAHLSALIIIVPLWALGRAIRAVLEPDNEALRVGVILAVLLHVVILFPAVHWLLSLDDSGDPGGFVEISLWDQGYDTPPDEEEKTPEEELEEYEPEEEIPEGEVVRAPKIIEEDAPDVTPKYLAEHTSRVKQETKSARRLPGSSFEASQALDPASGADPRTEKGGMRTTLPGSEADPSVIEKSEDGDIASEIKAPPSPSNISLTPSLEAMAAAVAGSGLDHLDDVISANSTALNTAGWKHASFFNRIKEKVEQFWHPDVEYRRHDPFGNIYGFKNRETVLLVVLHGDGSIKKLYVMSPSGASFLDDEALDAVRLASPFPNVPPGLRSKHDGLVKFSFHFIVEVGQQPVFRMRRYDR